MIHFEDFQKKGASVDFVEDLKGVPSTASITLNIISVCVRF